MPVMTEGMVMMTIHGDGRLYRPQDVRQFSRRHHAPLGGFVGALAALYRRDSGCESLRQQRETD